MFRTELRTRIPFKYGIATMTRVPIIFVRLGVEIGGRKFNGWASDLLPPKWFTKDPQQSWEEELRDMYRVIWQALEFAGGLRAETVFGFWQELSQAQSAWGQRNSLAPLLTQFGTSLVERAVLEAFGRSHNQSFAALVAKGALGIDLGAVHPELRGRTPADYLPRAPLARIMVRHTVGLLDPLTDGDIPEAESVQDSLPQSLAANCEFYRLRHFKLKLSGQTEPDLERLGRTLAVLEENAGPAARFSLDGNEQFKSIDQFRDFWDRLKKHRWAGVLERSLLFVEQPLPRTRALTETTKTELASWPDRPPIIVDESDGTLETPRQALDCGYAGTSHKNCKGVFKGIASACLVKHRRQNDPARNYMLTGEDLCNQGPIALLQDLAVMATLGVQSVERNGHHYVAGLSQFSGPIQQQVLHAHSDLYRTAAAGWPTLRIAQGELTIDSLNRTPLGPGFELDPAGLEEVNRPN